MLAFLLRTASSTDLPKDNAVQEEGKTVHESAVYFDVLVIDAFLTAKIWTLFLAPFVLSPTLFSASSN